jgi:hypothetical protein
MIGGRSGSIHSTSETSGIEGRLPSDRRHFKTGILRSREAIPGWRVAGRRILVAEDLGTRDRGSSCGGGGPWEAGGSGKIDRPIQRGGRMPAIDGFNVVDVGHLIALAGLDQSHPLVAMFIRFFKSLVGTTQTRIARILISGIERIFRGVRGAGIAPVQRRRLRRDGGLSILKTRRERWSVRIGTRDLVP